MIPEPMTAAASSIEPRPSAKTARCIGYASMRDGLPDASNSLLNRHAIQRLDRHVYQQLYARFQFGEGPAECSASFGIALDRCRIGNAPVCSDRLARPDRTGLAGGVVADRDDKVDRRRIRR